MRPYAFILLGLLLAIQSLEATPACQQKLSTRPNVIAAPKTPAGPHFQSPTRTKVCYVRAFGGGKDDSQTLFSAAKACNNGGTVALLDPLYTIAKPLDLTFLNAVDFDIQGTITFTTDTAYWMDKSFKYAFQNGCSYWQWGGNDVNWFGGGTIDGAGQVWYDLFAKNSTIQRPLLFATIGMHHASMSHINIKNPPNWFDFISESSDIIISDMFLSATSNNTNPVKNSDGWDTYRSDHITIQDSVVLNTDDCVSFKPNSTNILVQNMHCNGSHGMSVGSLGQYRGVTDIAENIYVYNATMTYSGDSARIKVYQDAIPLADGTLPSSSGGGNGYVKNITYDGMHDLSDDYAIELTTCYAQKNATLCDLYPSKMILQDIYFKNFDGTLNAHYDPIVGTLVCSSAERCININAENINITTPSRKPAQWTCKNVDKDLLDINCV
ncbi:hypothetical protein IFR04_011944 [Cadophora malorum]|uniref:galacturonan 1,4-alpha-galacturonidase n=1 Tax=Cadophora malorum TaxID=108018 RepID=A0A8H7T9U4_9HELO|nr:hypothetical protein IFR04_011944 [Cadophora malorum]